MKVLAKIADGELESSVEITEDSGDIIIRFPDTETEIDHIAIRRWYRDISILAFKKSPSAKTEEIHIVKVQ